MNDLDKGKRVDRRNRKQEKKIILRDESPRLPQIEQKKTQANLALVAQKMLCSASAIHVSRSCASCIHSSDKSALLTSLTGLMLATTLLETMTSRDLTPDVVLQIPLLLSAVTGLSLQALHMTLVDASFLKLNDVREHVINTVDGN